MSLEPIGSGVLPADLATIVAQELATLAADAQTLQARLTTGDQVAAIVLPSNGLTDLLDIGGLRVAAELPPTLLPGDSITVEVTGFSDDRINLQIVATADASSVSAPLRATRPAASTPAVAKAIAAMPAAAPVRSAPAVAVSAAVVHGASNVSRPTSVSKERFVDAAAVTASTPRPARPASDSLGNIEARLATARAASVGTAPSAAGAPGVARDATSGKPQLARGPAPPVVSRPPIAARVAVPPAPVQGSAPSAAGSPVVPQPRGAAAYSDPAALLRALQLPVTASNVTAARLALEAPQRLPGALQALERALSVNADPHAATLRTLVAFIGRLEPRSPVLATQISTFVDHVVAGRESKLAQLLDAHADASAARSALALPDRAVAQSPASSASLAAERVAVRQAALDYDLKTNLLALVRVAREPGATAAAPASVELSAAVTKALTAVTALQVAAAVTLAANPDGLAFTLPVALATGFARAHVRVDRHAPHAKAGLDGDNFHIAFVLDTQHLGTVAVDLVTVGRSVTLSVKTEAALAQRAFGAALGALTRRLESLRYRVAGAEAIVAPREMIPAPKVEPAPTVAAAVDGSHLVDLDA